MNFDKEIDDKLEDAIQLCDLKKCCKISIDFMTLLDSKCNKVEKTIVINAMNDAIMTENIKNMLDLMKK